MADKNKGDVMTKKNNKPFYEEDSWNLKVTLWVGIVFGFLIFGWEVVDNIPKYEYFERNGEMFMYDKTNGDLFMTSRKKENRIIEDGKTIFQHIGKIKY